MAILPQTILNFIIMTNVTVQTKSNPLNNLVNSVNVSFEGLNNLPAKKQVSELSQITQTINKTVEGNVRGLSSYFKEFRKQGNELTAKMKLYNSKGRTFDVELCHKIINLGEISHITKGSDILEETKKSKAQKEGKTYKEWNGIWSSNRLQTVFFFVVETAKK